MSRTLRAIKWSVLGVGEGDAEEALLRHLKASYVDRYSGVSLKVRQAYGKGALHVVNEALSFFKEQEYDRVLVLTDTDTDFDDRVLKLAEGERRLILIAASPCLEGMLLRLKGDIRERDSDGHKVEFSRRFGGRVQDREILSTHFPKEFWEVVREEFAQIHQLINTLGVKRHLNDTE